MTIQHIDHFDPITRRGQNLEAIRKERLPEKMYRWLAWLEGRIAKHRSRRALAHLDARLLEDVGLSREERDWEVSRSFLD